MKTASSVLFMAAVMLLVLYSAPVTAFDRGFNGTATSLSEELCEDIGTASVAAADGWSGYNALGLTNQECRNLCKDVKQTCNSARKNYVRCHKKQDAIQNTAERDSCKLFLEGDEKNACLDLTSREQQDCKDEVQLADDLEKNDCEDLEGVCLADCPGVLFNANP